MWLADCDKDKGNPSTVDRSHQLTLTFPHSTHYQMAANLQQLIICPPVFTEDGHHLVIQLTTGWLLGTICCWDGREHTPSLGFSHYPLTHEVFFILVLLGRTLMKRASITQDTFHGIVKPGEPNDKTIVHNQWWRDVYLTLFFDNCLWANMIQGVEWFQQVDWTCINDLVLLSLFQMGVLTGLVLTKGCTRWPKPFDTQPLCISTPSPILWNWNTG